MLLCIDACIVLRIVRKLFAQRDLGTAHSQFQTVKTQVRGSNPKVAAYPKSTNALQTFEAPRGWVRSHFASGHRLELLAPADAAREPPREVFGVRFRTWLLREPAGPGPWAPSRSRRRPSPPAATPPPPSSPSAPCRPSPRRRRPRPHVFSSRASPPLPLSARPPRWSASPRAASPGARRPRGAPAPRCAPWRRSAP